MLPLQQRPHKPHCLQPPPSPLAPPPRSRPEPKVPLAVPSRPPRACLRDICCHVQILFLAAAVAGAAAKGGENRAGDYFYRRWDRLCADVQKQCVRPPLSSSCTSSRREGAGRGARNTPRHCRSCSFHSVAHSLTATLK